MAGLANKVVILRNAGMGEGDDLLGSTILASFLRLVAESPEKPKAIFCYNGGVKLLKGDSLVLAHLQELAAAGVPVQACRTCVDFFGLREAMQVGELSSMAAYMEYVQNDELLVL